MGLQTFLKGTLGNMKHGFDLRGWQMEAYPVFKSNHQASYRI